MTVEELVEAFLVSCDGRRVGDWRAIGGECPSGGQGLCDDASEDFAAFCLALGVEAKVRWMVLDPDTSTVSINGAPLLQPHPRYPQIHERYNCDHCVAVVRDHVVDLTARQYDEELPFPFIWRL